MKWDVTGSMVYWMPLATAVVALGLGYLAYRANPQRSANRTFGLMSFLITPWLLTLEMFLFGGGKTEEWLRASSALGGFVPGMVWILKECIHNGGGFLRNARRAWFWLLLGVVLGLICLSDLYLSDVSGGAEMTRQGMLYYVHKAILLVACLVIGIEGVRQALRSFGQARLEMIVFALCLSGGGSVVLGLMMLAFEDGNMGYLQLHATVVLFVYGFAAWIITSHKLLSAHPVMAQALHNVVLIAVVSVVTYVLHCWVVLWMPGDVAWVVVVAFGLGAGIMLDRWLQAYFGLMKLDVPQVRQLLRDVAKHEMEPARLCDAYLAVLQQWSGAERAVVFAVEAAGDASGRMVILESGLDVSVLKRMRWVTPELLTRRRMEQENEALLRFMGEQGFGALVFAGGVSASIVLGLGYPPRHRFYPHSQMADMTELAAIIVNGLERARASWKARRAEQLATVGVIGASVAHEIRNPLVAIKTFVQLLPEKYEDPVFREKMVRILGPEVERIDQLVQHLLDLSSPRGFVIEPVDLNTTVRAILSLLAEKAKARGVEFQMSLSADAGVVSSDPGVIRQVLFNLCLNAFQALEKRDPPRTVTVVTRQVGNFVELCVQDNGSGIPESIRSHLFEPFTTDKSAGIGLGLALSRSLLSEVRATIAADPAQQGQGAVFRILFPAAAMEKGSETDAPVQKA